MVAKRFLYEMDVLYRSERINFDQARTLVTDSLVDIYFSNLRILITICYLIRKVRSTISI
jgi:hypothetical protein